MLTAEIPLNPLDLLHAGDIYFFNEGQVIVRGEFVAENGGEYIVPDLGSVIFV